MKVFIVTPHNIWNGLDYEGQILKVLYFVSCKICKLANMNVSTLCTDHLKKRIILLFHYDLLTNFKVSFLYMSIIIILT